MEKQDGSYKICRAGGREFKIYLLYDCFLEREVGVYPDFKKNPEYTDDGRPFSSATDEACLHGRLKNQQSTSPGDFSACGDCGGCGFFHRDETPWDIIGVCMCEMNRKRQNL